MLQSVKISELPSADTLTEDDLIVVDQPDDTKKATLFQVVNQFGDQVGQMVLSSLEQTSGAGSIGSADGGTVQQHLDAAVTSVESVNDLLSTQPAEGKVVNVKSYYAGTGLGGGVFVYRTAQASVNDQCTVINGWVRIIHNRTLTASDAGITATMPSGEATTRLNSLFAAAKDGYKFNLENIKIMLNTHARIINTANVEVYNHNLQGDKANWTFVNNDRGMLLLNNCPNIHIHDGEVIGVRISQPNTPMQDTITASGRIQDGDAGIELKFCTGAKLVRNTVHGVKTWGIIGTNCPKSIATENTVYDCARQSGISLCIGTTLDVNDVLIFNNTIYNVGLYGVELEKWTKTARRIKVYDNKIWDCQYGVNVVGLVQAADIHDNTITGCYYGVAGTSLNASVSTEVAERNYFKNNVMYGNYTGIGPSNDYYSTYSENLINGLRLNDYFIKSPYNTVEIVASATSFYSLRTLTVGTVLSINGMLCTVASSAAVTDPAITQKIGLTTVYLVVVDQLPSGLEDYTPFKLAVTVGESYGYYSFYLPNVGERVINNTIENTKYGFYTRAATSSNNDCIANDNTMINVAYPVSGATYGLAIYKSRLINCPRFTDAVGKLTYNIVGMREITPVEYRKAITASETKPTVSFYNYSQDILVRSRVIVNNVSWTTSATSINLGLTVNGVVIGYIPVTAKNTSIDTFIDNIANGGLGVGPNTIRIVDTTGSLSFDSWRVDLFVAD